MSSKVVGIEEARKSLGDLITAAQQGAEITITRNGKPAVRLVTIPQDLAVIDRVADIDSVTGVPLCKHGDDAAACQLAH